MGCGSSQPGDPTRIVNNSPKKTQKNEQSDSSNTHLQTSSKKAFLFFEKKKTDFLNNL